MAQNILLTGASSGIGLETARRLCERGHKVWGTARNVDRLPDFPGFQPLSLDLEKPETIAAAFDQFVAQAGKIDVVISNAGASEFGALETFPAEAVRRHFEWFVFGPLDLMQRSLAQFRKQQSGGMVIHVSSLSVQLPIPFMAPYSAAKAALSAFCSTQRLELGDGPICIVDYQPGDIRTPFHESTKRYEPAPEADATARARLQAAWKAIDHNMCTAPLPDGVGEDLAALVDRDHPGPVRVKAGFFQQWIAPLGPRFLPKAMLERVIRFYYGI